MAEKQPTPVTGDDRSESGPPEESGPASYVSNGLSPEGEVLSLPGAELLPMPEHAAWAIDALAAQRNEILERWVEKAAQLPFHHGRREHAVADHLPRLLDALRGWLRQQFVTGEGESAPFDDPNVLEAARRHAEARSEQGLQPEEIVTEFRLLRREIWRALHDHVSGRVATSDAIAVQLMVNDAIDGAIALALSMMTDRIEEVRTDFLATTVHEVRQPITSIKATAQYAERVLSRDSIDPGRLAEALQLIVSEADRMTHMLGTLVDVSRAALGQLDLNGQQSDLVEIVRGAIDRLSPRDRERVVVSVEPNADMIGWWDAERMDHVVGNLLSNAAKYSPPDTAIEVIASSAPDQVQLSVVDHGIGISPEDMGHLFQRYARGRTAVDQGIDGVGLGLFLSRRIVEAHGGMLWAESPGPGQGTTMHVVLPRRSGVTR